MILKALWRVNKTTVLYCIISVTIAFSRVRTGQKDSQTQRYRRIFVLKTEKSPFQTKMDTYVRGLNFWETITKAIEMMLIIMQTRL